MAKFCCGRYVICLAIFAFKIHVLFGHVEDKDVLHKLIPGFLRGHVTSFAGTFPISKDSIRTELTRRASQFSCQNDYEFSFDSEVLQVHNLSSMDHMFVMAYVEYDFSDTFEECVPTHVMETLAIKEGYLWVFVPSITVRENGNMSLIFAAACFTDSKKDTFLPHFGDYIFRVESLDFKDSILKLKNGSDEIVILMSTDSECLSVTDAEQESWHHIRLEPMFSMSISFNWDVCDKFTDFNVQLCEELKKNSCKIARAKEDLCFLFHYVGPKIRCEASMEILNITGVFSEMPLLKSIATKTALEAEWIDGDRKIDMITPCLTNQ